MGRYSKKQEKKQEGKVIGVEEDAHGGLLSRVKIETQLQVQMDLASHVQIMQCGLNFKFVLSFYNSTSKHFKVNLYMKGWLGIVFLLVLQRLVNV